MNRLLSPEHRRVEDSTDRYLASYNDTATWLAEALNGRMRTSFEFDFDGRDLICEDGRKLGSVFSEALHDAEQIAADNPRLGFEKSRREAELDEYYQMCAMARGEAPNTMVVVSEFPSQLSESIGGYDARRRQTMLRVISRTANGRIRIVSSSLDRSDLNGLTAIYSSLNAPADPGKSFLSQRVNLELDETAQKKLPEYLQGVYDQTLSRKFGGQWRAGRQDHGDQNTYNFVLAQHDLIDRFALRRMNGEISQADFYNLAAAIERRFEGKSLGDVGGDAELHEAGQAAREAGKSYSGCGLTINASSNSSNSIMEMLGFGNKIKKMHCPFCKAVKYGDPCATHQKCGACKAEVRDGKVVSVGNSVQKKKLGRKATSLWERLFSQK